MSDLMILVIVAAIVVLAGLYVYRAKKRGHKCVGCPHSKTCGSQTCSCGERD